MPYIVKKLETEEINFGNHKTVLLDVEATAILTKELNMTGSLGKGLSYKEIIQLKETFGDLSLFKDYLNGAEERKWSSIIKQIENIEEFYNIIWERTILELMFMSQYFISLISNLQTFEQLVRSGDEFEFWFQNNVKYNMLLKIKEFYLKTTKAYANKISIDVYETDIEIKVKEILEEIENAHLNQVKELLGITWNNSMEKFNEWERKQTEKRNTIIFG